MSTFLLGDLIYPRVFNHHIETYNSKINIFSQKLCPESRSLYCTTYWNILKLAFHNWSPPTTSQTYVFLFAPSCVNGLKPEISSIALLPLQTTKIKVLPFSTSLKSPKSTQSAYSHEQFLSVDINNPLLELQLRSFNPPPCLQSRLSKLILHPTVMTLQT